MEKLSFWKYFKLWVSRSFQTTVKDWFGFSLKTIFGWVLILLGFFISWNFIGKIEAWNGFVKTIFVGASTVGFAFIPVFIMEMIKAPQKIHNEQQEKIKVLEDDLKVTKKQLNEKINNGK